MILKEQIYFGNGFWLITRGRGSDYGNIPKKPKYDVKDRDDQVVGAFFNYSQYFNKSALFPNGYKL